MMQTHREYIDHTHDFDSSTLTVKEIDQLGAQLQDSAVSLTEKKAALAKLAHRGDAQAHAILKKYAEQPDDGLAEWVQLALGECTLFLYADLGIDDSEMVFTGVGENNNMMRIYFMVLPPEGVVLEGWQHDVVRKEMTYRAGELKCEAVEWFDCQPHYVGFSVLMPHDVAVAQYIDSAIAACNALGNFLIPEYYGATGVPKGEKELREIIDIVYHGEPDN